MGSEHASRRATATRVFIAAAPIYFVWEMPQAPSFTGMPREWWLSTLLCASATIGDVILLIALVAAGLFLFRDERWFTPPHLGRYTTILLVGLAAQIAIEWLAVEKLHLWGYQLWHARLPLTGTGLFPLLQTFVVPFALWLLARWETRVALPPQRDALKKAGM